MNKTKLLMDLREKVNKGDKMIEMTLNQKNK